MHVKRKQQKPEFMSIECSRAPGMATSSHSLPSTGPGLVSGLTAVFSCPLAPLRDKLASLNIESAASSRTGRILPLRRIAGLDVLMTTSASSSTTATATLETSATLALLGLSLLLLLWLLLISRLWAEWILLMRAAARSASATSSDWKP